MISILVPLFAIVAGFLAAFLFPAHRWVAYIAVAIIPPLLLAAYAIVRIGPYAWAGLLVGFVAWLIFVAFGSLLATFAVRPKRR